MDIVIKMVAGLLYQMQHAVQSLDAGGRHGLVLGGARKKIAGHGILQKAEAILLAWEIPAFMD